MEELFTIQQKLNAPKDKRNSFGNYNYRSCEGILEAVKPLLEETKCTLTITDDMVLVGNRIYVKATAVLRNKDGKESTTTAYAREEETKKGMDGSQITGAASSYARKYALNGLFCIDDNKDSDATNTHGKEPGGKSKGTGMSAEQLAQAFNELNACRNMKEVQSVYNKYLASNPAFAANGTAFYNRVCEVAKQFKSA